MSFCFLVLEIERPTRKRKKKTTRKKVFSPSLTSQPRDVQHLVHLARVCNVRVPFALHLPLVLLRGAPHLVDEDRHVARLLAVVGPERLEELERARGRVGDGDAELCRAVVDRVDVHPHDVPARRERERRNEST